MKAVFFDIDTQIDFMFPAGALYVPGAERILPAVEQLNRYAAKHGIQVVSTMDAHEENDPEFKTWPSHCVVGTTGQAKPCGTLLAKTVVIPNRTVDVKVEGAQQIILEKQQLDLFTNPNIGQLLDRLAADQYVVYGVVTEYCVMCAAMGLLATGKKVTLLTDAIQTLDTKASDTMLDEFTAKGGVLLSARNYSQGNGSPAVE
jgi:nicotinamidase/pyrazinamidase